MQKEFLDFMLVVVWILAGVIGSLALCAVAAGIVAVLWRVGVLALLRGWDIMDALDSKYSSKKDRKQQPR